MYPNRIRICAKFVQLCVKLYTFLHNFTKFYHLYLAFSYEEK